MKRGSRYPRRLIRRISLCLQLARLVAERSFKLNHNSLISSSAARTLGVCIVWSLAVCYAGGQTQRINVAASANGGVATASSYYTSSYWGTYLPAETNDGDRKGVKSSNLFGDGGWTDGGAANSFPDWLEIDFSGSCSIDEIDVFTVQNNYANPSEPTDSMTFSMYGLTGYDVQYWNGSVWATVPGGRVSSNNKVWRKFTFSAITTSKIRVLTNASPDGYSRLTEVEAWGTNFAPPPHTNVALSANGGVATASSYYTSSYWGTYLPAETNDGDRKGVKSSNLFGDGGWTDGGAANSFPDWLEIDFSGSCSIDEIDVFTVQNNYANPSEPTDSMTFSMYGLTGYDVQYWNGSGWATVPGGSVSSNYKVSRKFTFSPTTTSKIRVLTNASPDGYSRLTEVEAWTASPPSDPRLDPLNRTGAAGEDPLSRNFNWSLPLVSLPGRAGLDLGLSLAYNSLATWTKHGAISFDEDRGLPSPGFRLGFPVIQPAFNLGQNSYLLITPAGSRVELRQVGSGNLYQSVDSSYLLLDSGTMTLRSTDGTQMSYAWTGNDYVCTKVKDRNGNFITINYDSLWRTDTVLDTLARTIKFNYDANGLSSITQTWAGQTHQWARFTYTNPTIQTNFSGLTVNGPQNGTTIHALTEVKLADDSRYYFDYTPWGQIWKISNYAADNHLLNYRSYNLRGSPMLATGAEGDCPRFTERHDWAENWNRDANGNAQEVVTSFTEPSSVNIPGTSQTGMLAKITLPDGIYQKIYFGSASSSPAWQDGLPLLTETYDSNDTKQRWVTTTWTQDNTTVAYPLNPRVTENNIYDPAGNHARTRTEYAATNLSDGTTINLPQNTFEYQADATTFLRRTHVEYNLASTYASRRIIGLASEKTLYGVVNGSETLMSKVGYQYDESGSIQGTDAPVQHDNTYYSASLVAGRGNVSSVKRYDVNNTSQFTNSTVQYNTAGAAVATHDPLNHGVMIGYADSFSDDNNSRNTLAYPTTVTDADGFSSSARYNYDFGAVTRTQGPPPAGQTAGAIKNFAYDSFARIQKVAIEFGGNADYSHTRYEYPGSQNRVDTYATIQEGQGEAHSFKITDGYGRVIATAADHPGSTGGFSGQLIVYDNMGRAIKQSNPTETSAGTATGYPYNWLATGDDSTTNGGTGWVYTQQTYDWKGRPLVTTNTDSTTKSASYGGCGCAGGEVVTLTNEVTRRQKVYSDVLGRTAKTEVLNWDGSVYSTIVNGYNGRDQAILARQYQGNDQSGVFQDTTMSYDGYGRLQTKLVPEQTSGIATTLAYNPDDSVQSVTDARGATCTYGYNGRHHVTSATHTLSSQNTIALSYGYDGAGNRTLMTDAQGSTSYVYDSLSRMTSETRTFNGLGSYTLSYDYNLAGELKKITDPTNSTVNYSFDSIGRHNSVTGSDNLFAGVSTYASNFQYRAFDAVKGMTYGNSKTLSVGYDNRLQASSFEVPGILKKSYQHYSDGSWQSSQDQLIVNSKYDRLYNYDQMGRISTALSGAEARGQGPTDDRPYNEAFSYDAMNHLTSRDVRHWDKFDSTGTQTYVNNRNPSWSYDADGRLTSGSTGSYTYDGAGNVNSFGDGDPYMTDQQFDGDGQRVKSVQRRLDSQSGQWVTDNVTYYVNSTMLGGKVVTELTAQGVKQRTYVYAGQTVLAWQSVSANGSQSVAWEHSDVSGASFRMTDASGQVSGQPAELDPMGADAGLFKPLVWPPPDSTGKLVPFRGFEDMNIPGGACTLDRVPIPCGIFNDLMGAGAVEAEFSGITINGKAGVVPARQPIRPEGLGLFRVWLPDGSRGNDQRWNLYLFAFPQNLAPLPNRQNNNLVKATNALASKLASGVSEDCQKNVIDKLKGIGFDLNGFINFLGNNPQFYNGVTSQALAAGTVSPKQPADILYGPGATIADVFKGSGNTRPNALTSITSPTFLSFFRPDAISGSGAGTQSLIFHEGIHGFTGKVDADIQGALGIKQTPASQNITDYIRKHCF